MRSYRLNLYKQVLKEAILIRIKRSLKADKTEITAGHGCKGSAIFVSGVVYVCVYTVG